MAAKVILVALKCPFGRLSFGGPEPCDGRNKVTRLRNYRRYGQYG